MWKCLGEVEEEVVVQFPEAPHLFLPNMAWEVEVEHPEQQLLTSLGLTPEKDTTLRLGPEDLAGLLAHSIHRLLVVHTYSVMQ